MKDTAVVEPKTEAGEAFLITCEGETWRDVFRLAPGIVVTIGRETSNRIVLRDEKCSRHHCTVFGERSHWILRDLESRNGTSINDVLVDTETPLRPGDVVKIGASKLLFTNDLNRPLPRSLQIAESRQAKDQASKPCVLAESPHPEILERKTDTRYRPQNVEKEVETDNRDFRTGVAQLYRLVVRMISAPDVRALAKTALEGLCHRTNVEIAAVLLLPEPVLEFPNPDDLRLVAYRAPEGTPYSRVSERLSTVVLNEREAVLCHDVPEDTYLGDFETLTDFHVRSIICVPIRDNKSILGLIHLYGLCSGQTLDSDALDFTLAVADQMTVSLNSLKQKDSLEAGLERITDENRSLRALLEIESDLVGDSQTMQQLRDTIARAAASEATTLVCGESGVGKELVARAIHFNSPRRERSFVCLNCAALNEGILESELFGHEKGAFTGAVGRKLGKFEQADGGTLFLDEIGEMSMPLQAKLLRVLEDHPFERVGGAVPVQTDVRVVAATNRDLEQAVREGRFRQDLFFRLHILEITVPSLRERREDIPQLARHFLHRCCQRLGAISKSLSHEAITVLEAHDWPGNVRELKNTIERAVILSAKDVITAADISLRNGSSQARPETRAATSSSKPAEAAYQKMTLDEWERIHIRATIEETRWNKRYAARILGIERSTLDRKLKRYGIHPGDRDN